jgi:L-methionine (R)-S-oxide reductase
VQDVHQVPGHIACDGTTESEIVIPLIVKNTNGEDIAVGVLDIDCQKAGVWNEDDREGLESIVSWLTGSEGTVDWSQCT